MRKLLVNQYEKIDMKESEKLELEAHAEDNDLKFMGKMKKAVRQKRVEVWDEEWKNKIINSDKVASYEERANGSITFEIYWNGAATYFVDYYPKANKILIRAKNKWYTKGLNWLIDTLLSDIA